MTSVERQSALKWAFAQRVGSPIAKAILLILAHRADEAHSRTIVISQRQLAAEAEVSDRTARDQLARLSAPPCPLIERKERRNDRGTREADVIRLLVETQPENSSASGNRNNLPLEQ